MKRDSVLALESILLGAFLLGGGFYAADKISRVANVKAASAESVTAAEVTPVANTTEVNSQDLSCGDAVVSIAEQALDHPYQLGAAEWNAMDLPAPGAAIDCSAFTKWVYNRYGYLNNEPTAYIDFNSEDYLSRVVGWQARNIGRVVDHDPLADWDNYWSVGLDCNQLQKGDLLFFYSEYGLNGTPQLVHIGISEGGCRMIHAGTYTMSVDIIEDIRNYVLDEGIQYMGAKRVCPDISVDPGGKTDGLAPEPAQSSTPTSEPNLAQGGLATDPKQYITKDELKALLLSYPDFPREHLEDWVKILWCESGSGNTQALGDNGNSWGLGQINVWWKNKSYFSDEQWDLRWTAKGSLDMVDYITNLKQERGPWHYVWDWRCATNKLGFDSYLP